MVKFNWMKYLVVPTMSLGLMFGKGDSTHLDNYPFRYFFYNKPVLINKKGSVLEKENHYIVKNSDFIYKDNKIFVDCEKDSVFILKNKNEVFEKENNIFIDPNNFKAVTKKDSRIKVDISKRTPLIDNKHSFFLDITDNSSLEIKRNKQLEVIVNSDSDFVFESDVYGKFISKGKEDLVFNKSNFLLESDENVKFNFNGFVLYLDKHLVSNKAEDNEKNKIKNNLENFNLNEYISRFNPSKSVFNNFFNDFLKNNYSYDSFKEIFFDKNLSTYSDYFFNSIINNSLIKFSDKLSSEDDIKDILSIILDDPGMGGDPLKMNYSFLNYSLDKFINEYSGKDDFIKKYVSINERFGKESHKIYTYAIPSLHKLNFSINESINISDSIFSIPNLDHSKTFQKIFPLLYNDLGNLEKSYSLLREISNNFGSETEEVARKFSENILKEYKTASLNDIFRGIDIYMKYSKGDENFHNYLNNDFINFSSISSKTDFMKQISNVLEEIRVNRDLNFNDFRNISKYINRVHDNEIFLEEKDDIREYFSMNLNFEFKYRLIASSETELYPSSFLSLYSNFPDDLKDAIISVDPEKRYLTNFVRTLALRSKFTEILKKDHLFFGESLDNLLSENSFRTLSNNAYFLTESINDIYENEPDLKNYVENLLHNLYDNTKSNLNNKSDSLKLDIYSFLIKLNKNPDSFENEYSEIFFDIKKIEKIPNFLDDNILAMKQYFYSNEKYSFFESAKYFKDRGFNFRKKSNGDYYFETNVGKNKIIVELTKDIKSFNKDIEDDFFDVFSFRGHSTELRSLFFDKSDNTKLFYVGSCNSYRDIPRLIDKFPNSYFISNKYVSQGWINDILVYNLVKNLASGIDSFDKLEKETNRNFKNNGIVFPSDAGQIYLKSMIKKN